MNHHHCSFVTRLSFWRRKPKRHQQQSRKAQESKGDASRLARENDQWSLMVAQAVNKPVNKLVMAKNG